VSILAVLIYHLDSSWLGGGFVGVDIFFVISGFLITQLILKEMEMTGQFRFGEFYLRRTRRLFPALYVTTAVSVLVAIYLFSPPDLERLGGAALHSITSLSNVYFWTESGYFDTNSEMKPLLHTWSLAVEEQFYLFWPVTLFVLHKWFRKWAPGLIVTLAIISLLFSEALISGYFLQSEVPSAANSKLPGDGQAAAFFLTPFRIFEFAIGACLVRILDKPPQSRLVAECAFGIGLGLIAYSVFSFNKSTKFPGYNALLPCLGAAGVIYGGSLARLRVLISNRLMVFLGVVSYSLYLVHWPIIVFWKYYTLGEVSNIQKLGLFCASLAAGVLLNRLVEKPLRYPRSKDHSSNLAFGLGCALFALLLVIPAANIWATGGWKWRVSEEFQQTMNEMRSKRKEYWKDWARDNTKPTAFSADKLSIVVIGNSYAIDVANMLKTVKGNQVFFGGTTSHTCRAFTLPQSGKSDKNKLCSRNVNRFKRNYGNADLIVLADNSSTWAPSAEESAALDKNIELLRAAGNTGRIVIYGERPTYSAHVYQLLARLGSVRSSGRRLSESLETDAGTMRSRNSSARAFYQKRGIEYYSPVDFMCRESWCEVVTPKNKLIYFDAGHFTYAGIRYLSRDFMAFLDVGNTAGSP
jgi:peptidoglycan/LPS O-acetylase OafA/YrhL